MSNIRAGDEVRFLNATGGGRVVRLIDSRMALVAIEDGFEIPALISELVVVQPKAKTNQEATMEALQREIAARQMAEAEEMEKARKNQLRRFARNPEQEGFYLAFVPHEQQWVLTGPLDVVFVNHTSVEVLFAVHLHIENQWANVDYGQLSPYSKATIQTISRDELDRWSKGIVQALPIFDKTAQPLRPLNAHFQLKVSRFLKDVSYIPMAVLGEKAVSILLEPFAALRDAEGKTYDPPAIVKSPLREKAIIDKHRTADGEAVVDLHIGELVDNISGLSSHDMLKIQIDYFNKALDSAIHEEYHKVTFIHGVGNGVLKNAIIQALKNFEGTENRMASLSKFGVGAIEVLIRDR